MNNPNAGRHFQILYKISVKPQKLVYKKTFASRGSAPIKISKEAVDKFESTRINHEIYSAY